MGMTADGLSHWQAETEGTDLLEMTIGDLLDRRADELSTQEAIVYSCYPEFGDALAIRWTYQDYRDRANAVAKGLLAQGLAKGDHIAVWAANLPEWPILMMAAAKVGLVLVTINPVLQATEVEYLLKQGDVQALFFMARVRTSDHLATIRSLIIPGGRPGEVTSERLPRLRFVCLMGMPPTGLREQEGWRPALLGEVAASGLQVSEAELAAQQTAVTPLDPAMLLYTSGTTGSPKGVVLTHRGLLNNTLFVTRRWGMEQTDRFCLPVPFFHAKGVGSILKTLAAGATLHPLLAFDPQKVLQVISQERCTMFAGVPIMLVALMQHLDFTTADLSSLKQAVSGGAPVPVALMEQVKECTRADVGISFGQTESLVITQTLPDDPFERKAATVGIPLPHIEVKISIRRLVTSCPVESAGSCAAEATRSWLAITRCQRRLPRQLMPKGGYIPVTWQRWMGVAMSTLWAGSRTWSFVVGRTCFHVRLRSFSCATPRWPACRSSGYRMPSLARNCWRW